MTLQGWTKHNTSSQLEMHWELYLWTRWGNWAHTLIIQTVHLLKLFSLLLKLFQQLNFDLMRAALMWTSTVQNAAEKIQQLWPMCTIISFWQQVQAFDMNLWISLYWRISPCNFQNYSTVLGSRGAQYWKKNLVSGFVVYQISHLLYIPVVTYFLWHLDCYVLPMMCLECHWVCHTRHFHH